MFLNKTFLTDLIWFVWYEPYGCKICCLYGSFIPSMLEIAVWMGRSVVFAWLRWKAEGFKGLLNRISSKIGQNVQFFWFWIVWRFLFFVSWVYQKIRFFLEMALLWQMPLDVTKPAVCQPLDIKMVFLWHLLLQIQVFLTGVTSSVTVADKIKWAHMHIPAHNQSFRTFRQTFKFLKISKNVAKCQ